MSVAAAHAEVQALLRFLTQDAKVSLSEALPKIGALRKQSLSDAAAIVKAGEAAVKDIFHDEKTAKQIVSAAKRVTGSKKRAASQLTTSPTSKRAKSTGQVDANSEDHLELPIADLSAEELAELEIETNRAPLLLAFGVMVLKYTLPDQPMSSRLSLAKALVNANAISRSKSLGLVNVATAEDEGWAQGQPKVKVMSREIAAMRRHHPPLAVEPAAMPTDSQETLVPESSYQESFLGLDIEALRKSNGPLATSKTPGSVGPPIHSPEEARAYLLRSMSMAGDASDAPSKTTTKKLQHAEKMAMKERAVSTLLRAIDLLYSSWASTLSPEDLDYRAWSWYVLVRPDVAPGRAGWGQKGTVRLADILKLRREPD